MLDNKVKMMLLMLIAIIVMLCNKEHRCSPPVTHPRNGLGGQKDPAPEWRSSQPDLSNHHNIPTGQQQQYDYNDDLGSMFFIFIFFCKG